MPVTVLRAGDRGRPRRHLLGAHPPAGQEPAGDGGAPVGHHEDPADRRRRRRPLPRRRRRPRGALGRVFEIGGPDQLTYVDMLRIAAEVETGRTVPIITVPVLTPRLSSYWLALVTDVDVTTGRNLIDSMGVEVVVTDHAIREVVPGEPLTYEESASPCPGRGAREPGRLRAGSPAARRASRPTTPGG